MKVTGIAIWSLDVPLQGPYSPSGGRLRFGET